MTEQELFRLRVAYPKQGRLRHLGHLEVLRTVERSVRRAGLPYAVTQGFSPHMRVAFASALPTGTASRAEYYDLYMTAYVPAPAALERLQAATPEDLAPFAAAYVGLREPALTAALTRAVYRVSLAYAPGAAPSLDTVRGALAETAALEYIEYMRGKKPKRMDVARTLVTASVEEGGDGLVLMLDTRSSNEGALRPEVLIRAFEERIASASGLAEPCVFRSFGIERVSQHAEGEAGELLDPMPSQARPAGAVTACAENV